jgi:hypothetical protein
MTQKTQKKIKRYGVNVSFQILWYDCWVGWFLDTKRDALYVCPFPCFVFKFEKDQSNDT